MAARADEFIEQWRTFTNYVYTSLAIMPYDRFIRIVIIVGAYALLRPYIMKLGARVQTSQHEKELDPSEMAAAKAAIHPNSLRGQVNIPEDSESDDEGVDVAGNKIGEGKGSGSEPNWGKKARKRQRVMLNRVLEAEEKFRREQEEDEEDKDIERYLTM